MGEAIGYEGLDSIAEHGHYRNEDAVQHSER